MSHAETAACYGIAIPPENMSLNGQIIFYCFVFMVFCRGLHIRYGVAHQFGGGEQEKSQHILRDVGEHPTAKQKDAMPLKGKLVDLCIGWLALASGCMH